MIQSDSNDRLIQSLGANLTTVRRLPSPGLRALMWLAILGSTALALATVSDVTEMSSRLMAAPDMWLAALASMLTAVLAATAAFELTLPDRKATWALLPLPALLLWISASGMDCLRTWSVADVDITASLREVGTRSSLPMNWRCRDIAALSGGSV